MAFPNFSKFSSKTIKKTQKKSNKSTSGNLQIFKFFLSILAKIMKITLICSNTSPKFYPAFILNKSYSTCPKYSKAWPLKQEKLFIIFCWNMQEVQHPSLINWSGSQRFSQNSKETLTTKTLDCLESIKT